MKLSVKNFLIRLGTTQFRKLARYKILLKLNYTLNFYIIIFSENFFWVNKMLSHILSLKKHKKNKILPL